MIMIDWISLLHVKAAASVHAVLNGKPLNVMLAVPIKPEKVSEDGSRSALVTPCKKIGSRGRAESIDTFPTRQDLSRYLDSDRKQANNRHEKCYKKGGKSEQPTVITITRRARVSVWGFA
jgi:hypothetical protein